MVWYALPVFIKWHIPMLLFFGIHVGAVRDFMYLNVQEVENRIFTFFYQNQQNFVLNLLMFWLTLSAPGKVDIVVSLIPFLYLVFTSISRVVFTQILFPFYSLNFFLQLWQVQVQENVTVIWKNIQVLADKY